MVIELFEGGPVVIFDIKSGKQVKVNGHHLMPYVTSEPPTSVDMVMV